MRQWLLVAAGWSLTAAQHHLIPPFSPPDTAQCETLVCVQQDYRLAAANGPFNISSMVRHEFGIEAEEKIAKAYQKIQFQRPVIQNAAIETVNVGFKVSGDIQYYGGRYDAKYEGIFVVEQGGFISMHTGITFASKPSSRRLLVDKVGALVAKAKPLVVTWAGRGPAGMVFMTFERALVLFFGLKSVPTSFAFLEDHGEVGILVAQRAELAKEMYQDVAPLIRRFPISPFKFSGVLKEFTLSNNKIILVGALSLKPECKDMICKLLQPIVPKGTRLQFKYDPGFVTVDLFNLFTRKRIQAGLGDVRFHEKFILHDASLFLDLGMGGLVTGVAGSLLITPPENVRPLRFRAEIGKGFPFFDYELTLAMEGMYEKAFGIPFVHLGNIHGASAFETGLFPHTFRLGCELWLGKVPQNNSSPDTLHKTSAFVGFHAYNPVEMYFYAFMTNVTFQAILDTITSYRDQPAVQLPKFIGETGLSGLPGDDGVLLSFAPFIDYTIPFVDPPRTIRAGLTIAARLSLFGLGAVANVNVDIMGMGIDMMIGMEPILLRNGLIQVSKSMNERTQGPSIRLKAGLTRGILPRGSIDGYVSFLGMGMGINGIVTSDGFIVSGDLKLFNLIETHAELRWNVTAGETRITGRITERLGFLKRIEEGAANLIKKMFHRRLTPSRRELFSVFPCRIHIEKMSYQLRLKERDVAIKMKVRRTFFGKEKILEADGVFDLTKPRTIMRKIAQVFRDIN